MQSLVQKIRDFADHDTEHGWFEFPQDGRLYRFPKRAFMHYLFGNSSAAEKILPPYQAFSSRGHKMDRDNPFHTDAWLGAGFPIELAYESDSKEFEVFNKAGYALERKMEDLLSFDFTILANGLPNNLTRFSLMVYECMEPLAPNTTSNIHILCQKPSKRSSFFPELKAIVVPHAGIEFDLVSQNADIIITEAGGKLIHLATVSREKGKLLLRIEDACRKFPVFTKLNVNLENMTISIPRD